MRTKPLALAQTRSVAPLVVCACVGAYLFFSSRPLIWDIAWLIEASRRWICGAQLYRDVIEVNPPLIFYEMVLLSGGLLTGKSYLAGVCVAIGVSALWVARLRGAYLGFAALIAMVLGGMTDFGQRDHLALIFVLPFLVGEGASPRERACLGFWAFWGAALKPHFLLIPFAAVLMRTVLSRPARPALGPDMGALVLLSVGYLLAAAALHREFFTDIVPLAWFVYWTYGIEISSLMIGLTIAVATVAAVPFVARDAQKMPVGAATLAAIASYYLQGRYWTYHFVPAVGLGIFLSLWLARTNAAGRMLAALVCIVQLWRGPAPVLPAAPIPAGVNSVGILSAHVFPTYPQVVERGITNATRYSALWVLPGAWRIAHDGSRPTAHRSRARRILAGERQVIRNDLLSARPDVILADARPSKPYFNGPFDLVQFLGPLPGYRPAGKVAREGYEYDLLVRESD